MLTTEEQILQEIKNKGNFKARPLNKKIFEKTIGLPTKMEKFVTTEFTEFKLRTMERCSNKENKKEPSNQEP